MSGPRFKVATTEGHMRSERYGGSSRPGVSAHVLDTLDCHRVVDTFRSEGWPELPTEVARARAVMLAQVKCEKLNAAA